MSLASVGIERREPPEDAERALRAAFPECRYEWMDKLEMWSVVRVVPWDDIDRLSKAGKITREDVEAYRVTRHMAGHRDDPNEVIVHAFTLRDPETGDPAEPGSWVIEALRLADTKAIPGGARAAAREVLRRNREREERLEREQTEAIDTLVADADRANEVVYSHRRHEPK